MIVIADRDEGERQGVRSEGADDRIGVLIGEDTDDDVFRSVIGKQVRKSLCRFEVMRSVEPGLDAVRQRTVGQLLEARRPLRGRRAR